MRRAARSTGPHSEARALEAAAEAARRRLDDFDLKAPIDGVVLRRDGEPGEMVDTSDTVFWIGDPKPLRITADVDEEDVPRVEPGQKVLLRADAFPDRVLEGRLTSITPKGDPVQKTYRVRIELPDDAPLLIGMTVEANVVVREVADAVLVPTGAVRGGSVFVLSGDRAERREVELGVQGPQLAEVRAKLAVGELVIVDPPADLQAAGGSTSTRAASNRRSARSSLLPNGDPAWRCHFSSTSPWATCASASGRRWCRCWAWPWASASSSASTR